MLTVDFEATVNSHESFELWESFKTALSQRKGREKLQPCGSRHQEEKLKEIDKNCAALSDETVETFVASHHELDFKKAF